MNIRNIIFCSIIFFVPAVDLFSQIDLRGRRSELISYSTREDAEAGDPLNNERYVDLSFTKVEKDGNTVYGAVIDIPYMWLDRDIFFRVEGLECFRLDIDGRYAGRGSDSRTVTELNVSGYVTDGHNVFEVSELDTHNISLEYDGFPRPEFRAYIFTQPKINIYDYSIMTEADSTARHGILDLSVAVSNSYNSDETVTVGYDIYGPDGKLRYYDMAERIVPARDTVIVKFRELIYHTSQNLWSAEKPDIYYGMITVRRDGRMTEYLPWQTGFGSTELIEGKFSRNGTITDIRAADYPGQTGPEPALHTISNLKKQGFNTLMPQYPQPYWFYDICEKEGMYVVDCTNIHPRTDNADRNVGGTPTNDPARLDEYLDRTAGMFSRTRNRTCVIGWRLAGDAGNGFNLYRTYLWLKERDLRPVVYDSDDEWNSDTNIKPGNQLY